jgi:Raf kinase inhibitor-like YbhB/YbcL family protein
MALTVESDSITHGERVPDAHSFGVPDGSGGAAPEGGNRSPHLRWSGHPEGTEGFALIVYDPDVPADATDVNQEGKTLPEDAERADFAHWLLVDIPGDVTELPEGAGSTEIVVGGKDPGPTDHGIGGVNSYTDFLAGDPDMGGTYGHYDGPFPPFNDERLHHYHFVVYALDVPSLGLEGEFKLEDVRGALEGHVLDEGELVATYTLYEPLLED